MAILITSISFVLPTFAATGNSIDTVVEELSELYQEEAESGKELEDSAECRIIVKANRKPDTYGDAQFVKGTDKIFIYQYSDITSANVALDYYNSLNYVQWAETDGIMEGQSLSYGNDMMGSDEAKEYINKNISTNEVNVAVIDGGINFHLKNFIDSGRVIDSGVNLSNSGTEGTAQQDHGNYHGSNITSIILDNTSDSVNIIGYKALNKKGLATDSSVAMCIMTAVDDNVDIINLSLGAKGQSDLITEAVNYALENNVVVIVSAGNYCDDTADYYPANIENVITVGSIDYNGNRTFFSNYGEEVDFVAPGYNVEVWGNKSISSDEPDYASGTSFSAPFVTSAAAMVLTVDKDLSINQVKSKLIDSCVTQSEINYKSQYYRAIEISDENLNGFVQQGNPESEKLFYGYGMPQMQAIAGINTKSSSVNFSISSGTYNDEFELTLSTEDNADIYYTADERYPSKNNGTLYTKPIKIDLTTCIRAISYSDDKIKSVPSAQEYKIEYLADESDFEIDSRGYITSYNGKGKNGNYIEIKVPDIINGTVVKGVAKNAFLDTTEEDEIEEFGEYDTHLKGIVLPETVTEIEANSFENVYSLKYFSAPGLKIVGDFSLDAPIVYLNAPNIEYIGKSGLVTNLSEINLPKLTFADDNAFCNNIYLTDVNVPSLTEGGAALFSNCKRLTNADLEQLKILGDCSFSKCCWLKNIMMPKLEEISYFGNLLYIGMFNNCINLINIDLPKLYKLDSKTNSSFYNCYNLKSINAPKLEVIADEMFSNCYKLEEVNIPNAKIIGEKAFYFTSSLDKVDFNFVTKINTMAFSNSSVEWINTPILDYLGSYCFANYSEFGKTYNINNILKSIYAPELNEIDDYAFAYTGGLTELDLPNLKSVGNNAFYESSVNHLYVPNLVKANSLPVTENSKVVLSSEFKECSLDSRGYDLTIYGTPNTYAQEYAENNKLKFVPLPILVIEPPMEYTDINDKLSVEVFGFNKTYQWYGTYEPDNYSGEIINGATDSEFNPNDFKAYPYYYCVINTVDGEYKAELRTGVSKDLASPADYSEYNKVIEQAKSLIESGLYDNVEELEKLINIDISGKIIAEQKDVNVHTELIIEAISELKYKDADYSKVDELISKIPADLTVYTDESVAELNNVLNSIERDLPVTEQNIVDDYADKLEQAISKLEYKKADLDKLNQAKNAVPNDLSIYTDDSIKALTELIEKAGEYKNADITKQEEINTLAQQIYDAVDSLEKKEVPTEPTKPTPSDEPSTEPSTVHPSENPTNPSETTTEKTSVAENNTQNTPKRNTDTKSPLTGNDDAYVAISMAVLVCFSVLLVINSKRKKKSF